MKYVVDRRISWLLAVLSLAPIPASADLEVAASVQIHAKADFEAPLAVHGTWVEVGSYGRCWRPAHVAVGWRPYGVGEWVWTDCGWYWSSDEPWAWACYHYGSWVFEPSVGWAWVPQVEWAPAWVSWRVGGGYIGWAPLPPPGWAFGRRAKPELFVFVGEARFGGPLRSGELIANNAVILKSTTMVGGVKRESRSLGRSPPQKVMVNQGPSVDRVQKASGRKFAVVPIGEAARRNAAPAKDAHSFAAARKPQGEGPHDSAQEHGPGHADSAGKGNAQSAANQDSGSWRDSGRGGGGNRGGRSAGGGHGKH